MMKNLHVFTWFDIPVKIHTTWLLLVFFIFVINPYSLMLYLITIGFVILHEFGHSLMAKKFGIRVEDIVIFPVGGMARMESVGRTPVEEFYITLAGPLVNVCFSTLALLLMFLNLLPYLSSVLSWCFWINFILVVFNMLPCFPMDGGRILRSLLSVIMQNQLKATRITINVARVVAVLFVGLGLYTFNLMLIVIAAFMVLAGNEEYKQLQRQT